MGRRGIGTARTGNENDIVAVYVLRCIVSSLSFVATDSYDAGKAPVNEIFGETELESVTFIVGEIKAVRGKLFLSYCR